MKEDSKERVGGSNGLSEIAGTIEAGGVFDALTAVIQKGAVDRLASAVQAEVAAWIDARATIVDANGRRQVVRNGSMPERQVLTGIGPVKVCQPRVHDRRAAGDGREVFTSELLPPYLRKTRSMETTALPSSRSGARTAATARGGRLSDSVAGGVRRCPRAARRVRGASNAARAGHSQRSTQWSVIGGETPLAQDRG